MRIADVVVLITATGILVLGWLLLRDPRQLLQSFLTVQQLGLLEGGLRNLERAIIVAHEIEDPKDSLREAVRENFARGVKYLFLVSPSRFEEEKKLGYQIFAVLAERVIRDQNKASLVKDLVDIQPLRYEWDDTPYIFYELREDDRPSVKRVVAVRGNQRKEGIAEGYTRLEPSYARTIHRAVVLGGSQTGQQAAVVEDTTYNADPIVFKIENWIRKKSVGS